MSNPHRYWTPAGDTHNPPNTRGKLPEPGQLIAIVQTRQAWRVVEVEELHYANWSTDTQQAWAEAGSPDPTTWEGRERRLLAEPARNANPNGKDRRGLRLHPWWRGQQWRPLSDPYPACVDCGLLFPCPCDDRNKAAAAAMKELDRLGAVMPGCCWACNEPVTGRHHSIVFEGENLLLPGAGPAVFHTSRSSKAHRGTCRSEAEKYEELWVAAEAGRTFRLRCPGVEFRHFGDLRECSRGVECPGPGARHRTLLHCRSMVVPAPGKSMDEYRPQMRCDGPGCRGLGILPATMDIETKEH